MRGEHQYEAQQAAAKHGSSPHARGTLLRRSNGNKPDRIIPACAGNTFRVPL